MGIVWTALSPGWSTVKETFSRADVLHAFQLTLIITVITVVVTAVFGVIVAWVLVRQPFRGSGILNALVDLPFALSPVTVGLACVLLFGLGGWFEPFFSARGIDIIFALPSMVLVTIFISIPFVIRERAAGAARRSAPRKRTPPARSARRCGRVFRGDDPEHPLGAAVRRRALRRPRDRRDRRRARGERAHPGQDRDGHPVHLPSGRGAATASGYIVALTLAAVSILLLIGIETFKRRIEREKKV